MEKFLSHSPIYLVICSVRSIVSFFRLFEEENILILILRRELYFILISPINVHLFLLRLSNFLNYSQ